MGSSQQFCLKWNNHQANLLSVFERLLSSGALVDVTLACEGLSLKAHKMVLSGCSPFFETLFIENPCKHPIVILKDVRYIDLKAILEFMYRGEVNVPQEQLSTLLKTAETLKVKGLAEVSNDTSKQHAGSVVLDDSPKPVALPSRPDSPSSRRKRARHRRRSPTGSTKSDSEDQGPPVSRIKAPPSPEIVEDGSLSSDRLITPVVVPAASPARTQTLSTPSKVVPPTTNNVVPVSQPGVSRDSVGGGDADEDDDDTGVQADDADFEVEPAILMEQSMTTENLPYSDVPANPSSSQASAVTLAALESQHSRHSISSDGQSRVPVHVASPCDISTDVVDVKPDVSTLVPFNNQQQPSQGMSMAPVPTSEASGDSSSGAMMFMDTSGVQAIAGPSSYQPDQQATPSHGLSMTMGHKQMQQAGLLNQTGDLQRLSEDIADRPFQSIPAGPPARHPGLSGEVLKAGRQSVSWISGRRRSKRNACGLCSYVAVSPYALGAHMRTHTGERPFPCLICQKTFSQRGNLATHMKLHTGVKPFSCHLCDRSFVQKAHLQAHLQNNHRGSRLFLDDSTKNQMGQNEDHYLFIENLGTGTGGEGSG